MSELGASPCVGERVLPRCGLGGGLIFRDSLVASTALDALGAGEDETRRPPVIAVFSSATCEWFLYCQPASTQGAERIREYVSLDPGRASAAGHAELGSPRLAGEREQQRTSPGEDCTLEGTRPLSGECRDGSATRWSAHVRLVR